MKTYDEYVDQYGANGWKGSINNPGIYSQSALVAMIKDEVAVAGSTELSRFSRVSILEIGKLLKGTAADEPALGNNLFNMMYVSVVGAPDFSANPYDSLETIFSTVDARFKQYGIIHFKHGVKDDPFTFYEDTMQPDGSVTIDTSGEVNIPLLDSFYHGAINYTLVLPDQPVPIDITKVSTVITSDAIFQNMLTHAIKYGVATAEQVKATFGTYAPTVVAAALVQASDIKLPPLVEMSDPIANDLQTAFIAYFGRPADPGGFKNWIAAVNGSATTFENVINKFGESIEYQTLYNNSSSSTKVNDLYRHLFNRDAEAPGLKHWVDKIISGELNMANVAFAIARGAQNDDYRMIQEKIQVANNFTINIDTQRELDLYTQAPGALNARKYLSTVSANHDANVKVIGVAGDVINSLVSGVDGLLASNGLQIGFY